MIVDLFFIIMVFSEGKRQHSTSPGVMKARSWSPCKRAARVLRAAYPGLTWPVRGWDQAHGNVTGPVSDLRSLLAWASSSPATPSSLALGWHVWCAEGACGPFRVQCTLRAWQGSQKAMSLPGGPGRTQSLRTRGCGACAGPWQPDSTAGLVLALKPGRAAGSERPRRAMAPACRVLPGAGLVTCCRVLGPLSPGRRAVPTHRQGATLQPWWRSQARPWGGVCTPTSATLGAPQGQEGQHLL